MRKLIFVVICAIFAINAKAQFKFKSLDNYDGKTYDATSMVATQEGKRMSITMTFKRMTVFNNTSVTLKLNGQQVRIPIDLTEITNQLTGYKILIP